MDREDEDIGSARYGSVRVLLLLTSGLHLLAEHQLIEMLYCSMAIGLGMESDEWEELKGKVDDSFWVMRVIGLFIPPSSRINFTNSILCCRLSPAAQRLRRLLMWCTQVRIISRLVQYLPGS